MDLLDVVFAVYLAMLLHSVTISVLTRGGERTVSSGLHAFFTWSPGWRQQQYLKAQWMQQQQWIQQQQQQWAHEQQQQRYLAQQEQHEQAQWMQHEQREQSAWGGAPENYTSTQLPTLPMVQGIMQGPPTQHGLPESTLQPMITEIQSQDDDDGYARFLHTGATSSLGPH